MLPKGAIMLWAGTLASIPAGWQLCDGTNGTPDLRDRFVLGVSEGENPGATGGSHFYYLSVSSLPSHDHAINTGGAHAHTYSKKVYSESRTVDERVSSNLVCSLSHSNNNSTTQSGTHNHRGATGTTGGGAPIDNRPSFYKLAFICRL
jgi:microcystin-dependent protein